MEDVVVKDESHQLVGDSVRETAMKKAAQARARIEERQKANDLVRQIQYQEMLKGRLRHEREEYENQLRRLARIWFEIPEETFVEFSPGERLAIESDVLTKAKKRWCRTKIAASFGLLSYTGLIVYWASVFGLPVLLFLIFLIPSLEISSCNSAKKLLKKHKLLNSENPMKQIEQEEKQIISD